MRLSISGTTKCMKQSVLRRTWTVSAYRWAWHSLPSDAHRKSRCSRPVRRIPERTGYTGCRCDTWTRLDYSFAGHTSRAARPNHRHSHRPRHTQSRPKRSCLWTEQWLVSLPTERLSMNLRKKAINGIDSRTERWLKELVGSVPPQWYREIAVEIRSFSIYSILVIWGAKTRALPKQLTLNWRESLAVQLFTRFSSIFAARLCANWFTVCAREMLCGTGSVADGPAADLVAAVVAVLVSIAAPVSWDAAAALCTAEVGGVRAGIVAHSVTLVPAVAAVILLVAEPLGLDAVPLLATRDPARHAGDRWTVILVGPVVAVVLAVALPFGADTVTVAARETVGGARARRAAELVAAIPAVLGDVAVPVGVDALAALTAELVTSACPAIWIDNSNSSDRTTSLIYEIVYRQIMIAAFPPKMLGFLKYHFQKL